MFDHSLQKQRTDTQNKSTNASPISCAQRLFMVFCPCRFFNSPRVATSDCCLCSHELPLEEIVTIPPLVELSGTYVGRDPIPKWFIFLRAFITVFMIYIEVWQFIRYLTRGNVAYFFIYFTQWTHTICTISMIVKMYSTVKVYNKVGKNNDDLLKPITNADPLWKLYMWNSILVQISVPTIGMVMLNYFLFKCDWKWSTSLSAYSSLQIHGGSFVLVWIDFLFSAQRMYYKSASLSVLFGTLFTIWSIIFEIFVNMNEKGDPYIYKQYNWSEGIVTPIIFYFISATVLACWSFIAAFTKNVLLIYSGITLPSRKSVSNMAQSDESDTTEVDPEDSEEDSLL